MSEIEAMIITHTDFPEWYRIGFDVDAKNLIVSVKGLVWVNIRKFTHRDRVMESYADGLGVDFIIPEEGKSKWGLGGVIDLREDEDGEWMHHYFPLGLRDNDGGWRNEVSLNLERLLTWLLFPGEFEVAGEEMRQIFIITAIETGGEVMGNRGFSVKSSSFFLEKILKLAREESDDEEGTFLFKEVEEFGVSLWRETFSLDYGHRLEFRVDLRIHKNPERFSLGFKCPGDACELNTGLEYLGRGFELHPHNVDSVFQ